MSRPRLHDDGFLAFLRQKPCCICGKEGETEAAHIRIGFFGLAKKPDDRFTTPLCRAHHRYQHGRNEAKCWEEYGVDPFAVAAQMYAEYGGDGGKPRRKRTTIKPRLPKEKRAKIPSRPFPRGKNARG